MSGGIPALETMNSRHRKDVPPGHIVKAQPIKDSSYMESMVNFFHDIGQAYANTTPVEEKETVLWARIFDYKSVFDPESSGVSEGSKNDIDDELLLILGYKNGAQAWIFAENGDVQEILSMRQGPVKTACLVPPPNGTGCRTSDKHSLARPLLAICMAADRKQLFTTVSILSLRTQDEIHMLKFDYDVEQIRAGLDGMLIVTLKEEVQVFDTFDFQLLFTVKDCYPSPSIDGNPIAVAKEWLAYSPAKQISSCQSAGGMEDDGINSYAATVINAAKAIKKGLVNLSEAVNWLAKTGISGGEEHSNNNLRETGGRRSRNQSGSSLPEVSDGVPGLVTVINVPKLCRNLKDDGSPSSPDEPAINGTLPSEAIVAHFPAHEQPIVCMNFSPCGSLLATADKRGHAFHVFSILPHPVNPKMGAVHHLYSLYRGDTSAKVQEITFSADCRWLTASTLRGTSHIFPIATYGGSATVRTHVSHRVVNRSSLFHKSAGLEDMDPSVISVATNHAMDIGNSSTQGRRARSFSHGSRIHNSTNPRLPPHPQPTLVQPLAQIGTTVTQQVLHLPKITAQMNHVAKNEKNGASVWQADITVASVFTNGKLQLTRSPNGHDTAFRRTQLSSSSKGGHCLLIFNSNGILTEYHLEPRPQSGLTRISDDSPIELSSAPRFQWQLQRQLSWSEVTLPLLGTNPLLEVDNRRQSRIKAMLEMTSSSTSLSLSTVSAKSSDTQTNHMHETANFQSDRPKSRTCSLTADGEDPPKTQQPTSLNYRNYNSVGNHYPGMAVPDEKSHKTKNYHSLGTPIIPMGHHPDHVTTTYASLPAGRDQIERFNGQLTNSHHRKESEGSDRRPSSAESGKSNASLNLTDCDEWLAQVEMISHEGPARRLWMGPQFCFKLRQSTGSTMLLSSGSNAMFSNRIQFPTSGSPPAHSDGRDVYLDDDMDVQSLKIQPHRSDPMPTPKTGLSDQYELNSITIEAGSGNFDRTARMLEIGPVHGSQDDRSTDHEDRLRQKIAEAMLDSEVGGTKTRDIRSKSDASDTVEFNVGADALITVDEFEFDSEHPSLDNT